MSLKPFKKNHEILQRLKLEKGLLFKDEHSAIHILNKISYYRLNSYSYPFEEDINKFLPNIYFEDSVYKLYCVDEQLRITTFKLIIGIEIAFRTILANKIASKYASFYDFLQDKSPDKELRIYMEKFNKSNNAHIVYEKTYKRKTYKDLEPWVAIEMYEFGGLFILFNLLDSYSVKYIIKFFGFKNQSDLENCLNIIKDIRNIIAHHENILCRYSHRTVKQYHHKLKIYGINPEYYTIKTKKALSETFPYLYPTHRNSGYNPNKNAPLQTFYPSYLAIITLTTHLKFDEIEIQNFINICNDNAKYLGIKENWIIK